LNDSNKFDSLPSLLSRHIYAGVDVGEEIPSGMLFKFQKCYDLIHSSEKQKHHIDTKNDAKKTMVSGLVKYKRSEMEFGESSEKSDERPLGGKKAKIALKKQKKSMDVRESTRNDQNREEKGCCVGIQRHERSQGT
jgi:hypothetical protein